MDIKIYDKLAKRYDFATKVVSFGIEELWRWMFVREIKKYIKNGTLIDVASATGEMARALDFNKMYLIEPSAEMVRVIVEKFQKMGYKKEDFEVIFEQCPHIKLKKNQKEIIIIQDTAEDAILHEKADIITAFMALRNFDDLEKGMENLKKHIKPGGYFAVVEMVKNDSIISKLILWYMNKIVPVIAGMMLGMKEEYKLLGKSITSLDENKILNNLKGFSIVKKQKLIFPIATLIIAKRDDG
ncbi:methlytransferase [Nautilia profundicola AmH]|uniref:Methlytransferase n=1 Tax=Nautilia profundicola (strain ATCC BAA-1463 / DSM 18972 / AmH) TaxID=598659 RepID=B9L6D9_NAUPA|nr:class I SAM-dependent methyltransferase [Nautilia profundicola]ACM93478.1 methlytransferase [Nautilia profundicola AmH]